MVKSFVVLAVVAIALFGAIYVNGLSQGNILPGDRVLHSQGYAAPGVNNQIVSRTVVHIGLYNITAIRAYDRSQNQTGLASVYNGGLGQRNVTLWLQGNQLGSGYDFLVEIFGR
ncbi:uncharacterized protein LOC110676766 [Aedes aegypti]|uniref:Uncharacterized protein n=1 Tax=Aedes aegypti TaxID=7159 RepID=A0A6I8TZ89_AEDAE|nr:uncharacterized protein LOC110676766 [Aedes aegypti]